MNEAYGFPTTLQRYLDTAIFAVLVMLVAAVATEAQSDVRIKDLAKVQMGKEELLYGIGLVIGLEGTGDGRRAEFTFQMMSNMIVRQGISVTPAQVRVRNVAGAAVTATLSPFDRSGGRLDVHVASLGDASSLQGGTRLLTTLVGAEGRTYATASGPLSIGGFNLGGGGGGSVSKNHAVAGYIPNGGLVIDELEKLEEIERKITLMLYDKDWTTATRAAFGIDSYFGEPMLAQALDAGTVEVQVGPHRGSAQALSEFIAEIEKIRAEFTLALKLHGVDGLDVARLYSKKLLETPLLVTSGYLDDQAVSSLDEMGGNHLLDKPAGVGDLLQAVDTALSTPVPERKATEKPRN